MDPFSDRKARENVSPCANEKPTTWPRLLRSIASVQVPPRLPTLFIPFPLSQIKEPRAKGKHAPTCVVLVYDHPKTCPRSLMTAATASVPPNVPKSCMTPRSHSNARTWVDGGK